MENRENILTELREVAPGLVNIGNAMPFAVPEDYFDVLPLTLLAQTAPRQAGMTVPEGYFDALPAMLLAKVKSQEQVGEDKAEDFPLLNSISKQMPYSLPAHYFENLEIPVPHQQAKIIPIGRGFRKMAGWAVAASILALVSIFGWRYFNGDSSATSSQQFAGNQHAVVDSLSKAELANALSQVEEQNLDEELDNYGLAVDQSALYYLSTVNFEKALQGISDEELSKSLETQAYIDKKS